MIKIQSTISDIEAEVTMHLPGWHKDAAKHSQQDKEAGRHIDRSHEIWSKLKPFFSAAQLKKCIYCESILGSKGVRWQIDHFRPKARVDEWLSGFADQAGCTPGYYQLAYTISNYLGTCESCNNTKHSYFPVHAPRQLATTSIQELAAELPLLINPLDESDDDPEKLIEFYGPFPRASQPQGVAQLRARATILVLGLEREDLVIARCQRITAAWTAYRLSHFGGQDGEDGRDALELITAPYSSHANCVRSFLRLCATNPRKARSIYKEAADVIRDRVSAAAVTDAALGQRTRNASAGARNHRSWFTRQADD